MLLDDVEEPPERVSGPPERYVPAEMRGELVEAEHLARYWWAGQLAAGRRVLDAGCGLGYGSDLLAAAGATSVHGVDLSPEAVEAARATAGPGVELSVADVAALPFPDGAFDLVVCFEVIEHIEARDAALDEFARVLAPGGLLALSSPNRGEYPPGNPHHVHEYEPAELRDALARRFASVAVHRQQGWTASAILDDDQMRADRLADPLALTVAKVTARDPGRETYSVALAGDGPLPVVGAHAVLTGALELERWLRLYDEQRTVLDRQHALLSGDRGRDGELALLHRRLREAEQELAEVVALRHREQDAIRDLVDTRRTLDAVAVERDRAVADAAGARAALAQETARADRAERVRDDVMGSLSWRITAPLRRLKPRR